MLLPVLSRGQGGIRPLTIGDTLPGVAPAAVIRYSAPSVSLNSFTNKLVLLDFMNTYCSSCIAALPGLDSLQHAYAGRLQVFMVTNEHKARAQKLVSTNATAKTVSLPFIIEDTVLEKLFPHAFVSHEVWIYNGIVKAITTPDYVTEANILTVLSGETPRWPVKSDVAGYDYNAPLLTLSGNNKNYVTGSFYGSVCTTRLGGVGLGYIEDTDSITGAFTIRAINYPVAGLYLQTLTDWRSFPRSHIRFASGSEAYFVYPGKTVYRDVWEQQNTYCYEATFPPNTPKSLIRQKIQTDLDVYLQVQSSFETRPTPCYVLLQDSAYMPPPYSTEDYTTLLSHTPPGELIFLSPADLIAKLNDTYWGIPFYNGISPGVPMPVILPHDILTDTNTLKKALELQHLYLKEVIRNENMLVLKKNKQNLFTKTQH